MNSIRSILGWALVAVGAGVAACEGEPPKTPESATVANQPALAAPDESESASAQAENAPPPAATCCQCQCPNAGDAGAAPIALANDAGPAAASDAGAPPAAPTVADVVGDVTTTPAYLRGATVVYLENAPKLPDRGMRAHMDNHNMAFSPIVQVVAEGGSVSFLDSDPFPHNVFSPDHERFDLGLVQSGHSVTHKFNHAGVYTLLCNLHPNMIGYVLVSPSSFFAKTDGRGHYRIKGVPPGKYSISAWAPRLAVSTQAVEVAGKEAKVDFELHR